jgi:3-hydroxyacyl-CoA dehydrogenase
MGSPLTIGIAGAGSIGVSFAILFARQGWPVRLWDPDQERCSRLSGELEARAHDLIRYGLFDRPAEVLLAPIEVVDSLERVVDQAHLVMECAPEKLAIKTSLFATLDALAGPETILASASSAIPVSQVAEALPGRSRCLVAHPGNPPHLIPVIEIVPAPFTSAEVVQRAKDLFIRAGQKPVVLNCEIEGFIFNRLQGALLREAYCLVRDHVASVEDIDCVVREGLGLRWSVIGPFETADLNTRGGIEQHAAKLGPAYERMGALRGQHDPWTPGLVAEVTRQRRALLPLEQWDERVAWRDRALMTRVRQRSEPQLDGEA